MSFESVLSGESQCYLHLGDCLEYLRNLPNQSINHIVTDPPYFEIKGDFDFAYESHAHYLEFMEECAIEFKRILKPNGCLLMFGHAKRIAYLQVIYDKFFNLENSLVWEKKDCQAKKGINNFRCFAPITERILYYSLEPAYKKFTIIPIVLSPLRSIWIMKKVNQDCLINN